MGIIAKYKFNQNIYANFIPEFNSGFADYTITDEIDTDGFTIRTIESDNLPTLIRFGSNDASGNGDYTKQHSLLEVNNLNTINVTDMSLMFYRCANLIYINTNFNTSKVTDMYAMFSTCNKLTSLDLSNFNTNKVTTMYSIFRDCFSLTSLDVSNFNTSNVDSMYYMFSNCSSLTSLDLSSFNTGKVTNMNSMFNNCSKLTSLDLSSFNTGKVINMNSMFYNCSKLTSLDVSNFNTSNVINMYAVFLECKSLTSLDLSNFNTSKVTSMGSMFYNCSSLTSLELSSFNTSNVTVMNYMFSGCTSLISLDVSKFDTSNVTNMNNMFINCKSLTSLDLSNFNTSKVTTTNNMFSSCGSLIDIGAIYCDSSTINKIVDLLTTNTTIWYQDAELSELTPLPNITYKEYKCTTVETDVLDGVVLRAVGNVKDELNLVTGELTQRIGEIVLDGGDNFQYGWNAGIIQPNSIHVRIFLDNIKDTAWLTLLNDKLPLITPRQSWGLDDYDDIGISSGTSSNQGVDVRLWRKDLLTEDLDGIKEYLSNNPITVQYELETESIKTVDLTKINQDNEGINYISSYDTVTHFETSSESLFPTVSISPVSYPTALKANTTYTLMFNKVETSNNPLVVNLGGTQIQLVNGEDIATITTPNTLANQNITWYGAGHKVSEIMVLEGNIEKLPYFEGSVPSRISTLTTVHDNGIRENTLIFDEEIILRSNNTTKDTLDLLTGQLIRHFDTNGNLLETPTTETVTYTVYNNGASDDVLALIPDDNIIFDSGICPRLSYKFDVIRERLFSYNTISSKELYTKDENFAIVYGDHRGEVLPQLDEMSSCINPSITFSDGSNSNTHEIEGTFRSVGTKFDEVDVINNTATINFGTFILDGTENWVFLGSNTNTTGAYVRDYLVDAPSTNNVLSTCSIGCGNASDSLSDEEGVYLNGLNRYVYVRINNDKLQSQDVAGVAAYLNENPIEVIYQLAKPVEMSINVTSDGDMVSYEDVTYVSLTSDSGVLPHETTVQVVAKTKDVVEEVSTLSLRQNETEEQIEEQSDENLISMVATTEIYENLL